MQRFLLLSALLAPLMPSLATASDVLIPNAASECHVEAGFDYVGNDLFSLRTSDATACCAHCLRLAVSGCRAYTWTDHEDGTCWLKRGRGAIEVNAKAKSGSIGAFRFSETCELEHGIDYVGNDMGSVRESEAGGCCAACEQIPGCRAFTFTTKDGGTCWLKSGKGNMVMNSEATSAQVYSEEPTCGFEHEVEYIGNDVGSARASDPSACCSLCEAFGGCRAFSWTSHEGGTCWFKNRKDEVSWEVSAMSGQVLANSMAPSCALEIEIEYLGNDIGSAPSVTAYGCCSICMATEGCNAFSWSNYDGGTCWLKSSKGDSRVGSHFSSATV